MTDMFPTVSAAELERVTGGEYEYPYTPHPPGGSMAACLKLGLGRAQCRVKPLTSAELATLNAKR